MARDGRKRVRHGVHITDAQINVLEVWKRFVDRHGYQPTQVELSHLSGAAPSQISLWIEEWLWQGLVTRARGIRSRWLTERCLLMLEHIDTLDRQLAEYNANRREFIKTYSVTYSRETPDISVQRENSRYEESHTD